MANRNIDDILAPLDILLDNMLQQIIEDNIDLDCNNFKDPTSYSRETDLEEEVQDAALQNAWDAYDNAMRPRVYSRNADIDLLNDVGLTDFNDLKRETL